MKSFGELLNQAITSKSSINSIAAYCGVSPRTIYRYINNERTPDEESFYKIIRFLSLNPREKKELTDSYNASVIGIDKYQRMLAVEQFLRKVISMKYTDELPPLLTHYPQSPFSSEVRPIENSFQIQITIQVLLSQEASKGDSGHIYIVSSNNNLEIFDALAEIVQHSVKVEHIISLSTHTENAVTKGIQYLSSLAPIAMTAKNYSTFSYYKESLCESSLPYFSYPEVIITSEAAMVYNCTSCSGILFSSPRMATHFQTSFNLLKHETSAFTRVLSPSNLFSDFLAQASAICHDDSFCCTIRTPLSITMHVTEDIIRRNAKDDPFLQPQVDQYIAYITTERENGYTCSSQDYLEITTTKGIQILLDTGEIQEIPESLYNRLSMEDRIQIVDNAYHTISTESTLNFRLLKDNWDIGDYGMTLYFSNTLVICYFKKKDGDVGYFTINDPGIATAFCEYFIANKDTLCYPREESKNMVKEILDKYKQA